MRRKIRRISLNAFQPQCDLKPYLETYQQSLSAFETSLLLMQIIKKHEKLMFKNKQNQVQVAIEQFQKQNLLLGKIREKLEFGLGCGSRKQKVLASSYKVLQQLDVNRKHAYKILQQQNKQIADRIYALQTALSRMTNIKRSQTLSIDYLQNLQNKVKSRKNILLRLKKLVQQTQQTNQQQIDKSKKLIAQITRRKYQNIEKQKEKQKVRNMRKDKCQQEIVEDLLENIFLALQNQSGS